MNYLSLELVGEIYEMFMIFDKNIYISEFIGNFGNIEICFFYLVLLF